MGGSDEESRRAEIRLGRDMAAALVERTPLAPENETTQFAGEILLWLASHVRERRLPFSVRVTGAVEANATALPGGPIFLSWPLVELCRGGRDELAFVIAHEMGHIIRKHTVDRLVKDAALHLLLRQTSGRLAASSWLSKAGGELLKRGYSREDELEADAFAAGLVKSAGGDIFAGERLLERLGALRAQGDGRLAGSYFSTHPSFAERLISLRQKFSQRIG
jgi:predicted Zn-dependent protease